MIYIESKDNKLYKTIKKLKDKKHRMKERKYILEGFRLTEELLGKGRYWIYYYWKQYKKFRKSNLLKYK